MVICPDCGRDVPEAKFCKNCGAYISNLKELPLEEEYLPAEGEKVKYCIGCGKALNADFKFCPYCGQNQVSQIKSEPSDKSTGIAVILSILLPGMGQIYLGLDNKGAVFLIAYVVSAILMLLFIGIFLCALIWIWALADTVKSSRALNEGKEVKDKIF